MKQPVSNELVADFAVMSYELIYGWLDALEARHLADLTRPELTRAIRALSVRYVEQRQQLTTRSPLDSAGKRAAFGLFYAPLHFLTVQAIVQALDAATPTPARVVDLGCGTGVCSAAWALACAPTVPTIEGLDLHPWALDEARWNWRTLGLRGRAVRGDLLTAARRLVRDRKGHSLAGTGIIAGWAVNEVDATTRAALLTTMGEVIERGASVLLIEPLARGVAPWWTEWCEQLAPLGARALEEKFDVALPPLLEALGAAAGFPPRVLGARILFAKGKRG